LGVSFGAELGGGDVLGGCFDGVVGLLHPMVKNPPIRSSARSFLTLHHPFQESLEAGDFNRPAHRRWLIS
jgi:hypothetical protein